MSSPEELTFVLGRWLRPVVAVLVWYAASAGYRYLAVNIRVQGFTG